MRHVREKPTEKDAYKACWTPSGRRIRSFFNTARQPHTSFTRLPSQHRCISCSSCTRVLFIVSYMGRHHHGTVDPTHCRLAVAGGSSTVRPSNHLSIHMATGYGCDRWPTLSALGSSAATHTLPKPTIRSERASVALRAAMVILDACYSGDVRRRIGKKDERTYDVIFVIFESSSSSSVSSLVSVVSVETTVCESLSTRYDVV